jgi:N-acetyl sugar amidotransferase
MDTTDPDIEFDQYGHCNHCRKALERINISQLDPSRKKTTIVEFIAEIKKKGKGKKYDCIIGVSGGVDSTYVAYQVKKLGLNPLAVHLDNGWNSELAVSNIEKTLKALNIDLYTFVIDWEEFKDLQLSFLKASTPDSEVPTDHAIISILYRIASKYNLEYILNGVNVNSESIMPLKWGYGYFDNRYIKSIHKKFGNIRLKSFPSMTLLNLFYYKFIKKIKFVPFLNYLDYQKEDAMNLIQEDLGWVYYGGKHYESIYTRFFQAHILPNKFNIDKRKSHFSSLIVSNQMTRENAVLELKKEKYSKELFSEDYDFVLKKFNLDEVDFKEIMLLPTKTFLDYDTNYHLFEKIKSIIKKLKLKLTL